MDSARRAPDEWAILNVHKYSMVHYEYQCHTHRVKAVSIRELVRYTLS